MCERGINLLPSYGTKDLMMCQLNSIRRFITLAPGTDVKFAWVGVPPASCNCYAQMTSPNGNAAIDAAVSVIGHELAETVTDPTGINVIKIFFKAHYDLK